MPSLRLAPAVLLLAASTAGAHPLGNFTVNRYARLEPSAAGLRIVYAVDYAEVPALQEIGRDPELPSTDAAALRAAPRLGLLRDRLAAAWPPGLRVTAGGGVVPLALDGATLDPVE